MDMARSATITKAGAFSKLLLSLAFGSGMKFAFLFHYGSLASYQIFKDLHHCPVLRAMLWFCDSTWSRAMSLDF